MKQSIALALVGALVASCAPDLPLAGSANLRQVTLDQQWSPAQSTWFHHVSQGTATFGVPYEWFMALPAPDFGSRGRLGDPEYLRQFGFIPSPATLPDNPDGLPIGFARGNAQVDPRTGKPSLNPATGKKLTEFGLTCAACHTGQIEYGGQAIVIDGGSAMTDLGKLRQAIGLSILRTALLPDRFDRFAAGVLGPEATPAQRDALRVQFKDAVAGVEEQAELDFLVSSRSIEEGFGRLDALNRIGNEVFAMGMRDAEGRPNRANYAAVDAPVHFPRIWDSAWFSWAQYDGSIQQPMVRNAGEAMGVRALVNLSNQGQPLLNSSVDFSALERIEQALAGPYAEGHTPLTDGRFTGLAAPRWPAILPPIDAERAARGGALYATMCSGCHLPAPNTAAFWDTKFWRPADATPGATIYLDPPMIPIAHVGTDPAQASGIANRRVVSPPYLNIGTEAYGRALGNIVAAVADRWYGAQLPAITGARRDAMNGLRPNGIRAPLAYRTRPLDGIWASPPYLHNGSVPSLYALLSPLPERPAGFWLGTRAYDPVDVGYVSARPIPGGFWLDTRIPGNSNAGHEFDDGPERQGRIGRKLLPDERRAIVEYLKTL